MRDAIASLLSGTVQSAAEEGWGATQFNKLKFMPNFDQHGDKIQFKKFSGWGSPPP